MKKMLVSALYLPLVIVTGCVTSSPNPAATSLQPVQTVTPANATTPPVTNTVYITVTNAAVPPVIYQAALPVQVSNAVAEAQAAMPIIQAVLAATPAAPAAPFLPSLLNLVLGGVALVSGGVAAWKNSQAQSHAAAAAALASAIQPGSPQAAAAMSSANINGSTAAVAQHLANAQSPV
jgi:hypothetical protein